MRILVCAGHTAKGKGTGAVGYINESTENRILSKKIVEWLKRGGADTDYYEINEANDYLQKQVASANSKNYDLVVQIHFNARKNTMSVVGTETLYKSSKGKVYADRINSKLSSTFKNRGVKERNDLYWLNNTKAPSILIETCFVDSKADTDIYILNKDIVARLIAEGILNKQIADISTTAPSTPSTFYRVVCGSYSNKANAEAKLKDLEGKGYKDCFIDVYKK